MTGERPTIQERYTSATNTSDLTIAADRTGQGDVILAAGMVRNRLGHALIHLMAEWDRTDKPRKRTAGQIAARAIALKDRHGKPDHRRAAIEAMVWHASAMRQRAATLAGRNQVLGLLQEWAALHGVDPDILSPAIFHWLAPTCPACDGHGKMRIPETPVLGKRCNHCDGIGRWPAPLGATRVHQYMAACLGKARAEMVKRMYGQ
jgi:hypothetical protein